MPFSLPLECIYICIYLQPGWYLHSQEYSVRNTKVLRKKLLKISSRLQENYFHMVRPESPVLVVQRQLGRVRVPRLQVQESSGTGRFRSGARCGVSPGRPAPPDVRDPASGRGAKRPSVGPSWAVGPPTQSHFLGDPGVAQEHAFGIPEGVRNPPSPPQASPHSDRPHAR